MISGIVAGQIRNVAGAVASIVGVSGTPETLVSASVTVTIPGGAALGDTLIAFLRCREDRSFSLPAGWTVETDATVVGSSSTPANNTRIYVLHKPYAGETNVTFTQSTSAACVAVIAVVRGTLGGVFKAASASGQKATTSSRSLLLALGTGNNSTSIAPTWNAPFTPVGSFRWSGSSPYFYGSALSSYAPGSLLTATATYTWSSANPGSNYIWIAEILPPS